MFAIIKMRFTDLRFNPELPVWVRLNRRTAQISLRVGLSGLSVTLPYRIGVTQALEILTVHRTWISDRWNFVNSIRSHENNSLEMPAVIHFQAVNTVWQVIHQQSPTDVTLDDSLQIIAHPPYLQLIGKKNVIKTHWQDSLRRWVQRRALAILGPWLAELSAETGLRYSKLTVRGQKSRWGSCSSRGAISLNYQLLFLPPEQVRYVLIHELCHTVEHNHSERFWALVARWVPEYRYLRQAMKLSAQQIPAWIRTLG